MHKSDDSQLIDDLLKQWSTGNQRVEKELIDLLYPHIHRIAHMQLKSNHAAALQTTEIVSEAFIKLNQQKSFGWKNQSHFLAIATKVIRRVLVDHFRSESSQKRGGHEAALTLERFEHLMQDADKSGLDWLDLHQLLNQLHAFDPDAAAVLEYKVFGGLTYSEMAAVMSVSESTVLRNWNFAKSWVIRQLDK